MLRADLDDIYDLNVGGISVPDSVCNHARHIGRRFSVAINTPNRKSLAIIWKAISCFHGKLSITAWFGSSDFQTNLVFGSNFLNTSYLLWTLKRQFLSAPRGY